MCQVIDARHKPRVSSQTLLKETEAIKSGGSVATAAQREKFASLQPP
jgi:hypothetical protein